MNLWCRMEAATPRAERQAKDGNIVLTWMLCLIHFPLLLSCSGSDLHSPFWLSPLSYLQASQKHLYFTRSCVFFLVTEAGEEFWGWRFSLLFPKMIINDQNANFMFSCIPDLIKVPYLPRSVVLAIVYQEAGRTQREINRLCQFNLVRSDSVRSSHLISFFKVLSGEGNFPTYDLSTDLKLLLEHQGLHIHRAWWLSGKFIKRLDRSQAGWPQNCWSSVRSQDTQFCQWDLQGPYKKNIKDNIQVWLYSCLKIF